MAITNYLVHFTTETTYNNKKSELRNDAVAFVKDATIIHTHGTDYYCGSGPVALKSDLSGYATTSALTSGLAGKANTSHTHTIAQVSGLQTELDSKLESADLSGYALKTDIPSLSGGASATSGQYVSGVTVSGHKITVTKATLPVTTLSSLGITATAAELNYCDGVTSNIQTQLNGKAASSHTHTASQVSGLATVATSGSYNDLSDKPSIPSLSGYATQSWVNTQLDDYLPLTGGTVTGNVIVNGSLSGTTVDVMNLHANGSIYLIEGGELNESSGDLTWNGTVVSLEGHKHSASDITSGTLALARIPTGTSASTVALGNHIHSQYIPISTGAQLGANAELSLLDNTESYGVKISKSGITLVADAEGHNLYADLSDLYWDNALVVTENNYHNIISTTDTKNTTGTSNSTSKLYLAGGTTQNSAGVVTYSNNAVYTQSGQLYANQMNSVNGFYETSDARLKNFKDDIKVLDVVSEIPTKYFTWKKDETDENSDSKLHIGTSAQEIQKLYPDLVTENEEGELSVDYARLSVIALAAIKELKKEIDILKSELVK